MNHHINIVRIRAVANALVELKEKVVFVGGATTSLYPDKPVLSIRPTDDVDIIIEILNYVDRARLEEKLRAIGFSHDIDSGLTCRYKIQGITVDVMPTNDPSIGFSNKWYPEGYNESIDYKIDEWTDIKMLAAPYFIATKLEAFKGRGGNDGRTSHDFEDIVYVLENREAIWEEMNHSNQTVKEYLKETFRNLLSNTFFFEWIDAHVEKGYPPASYWIVDRLKEFVK